MELVIYFHRFESFSCQVGPFEHGMGHSQFAGGVYVFADMENSCEYIEKKLRTADCGCFSKPGSGQCVSKASQKGRKN
jgi:hypothetical protein